jgi:hypothetical protein
LLPDYNVLSSHFISANVNIKIYKTTFYWWFGGGGSSSKCSDTWRNSIHLPACQYNFAIDGVFSVFKTVHFRRS